MIKSSFRNCSNNFRNSLFVIGNINPDFNSLNNFIIFNRNFTTDLDSKDSNITNEDTTVVTNTLSTTTPEGNNSTDLTKSTVLTALPVSDSKLANQFSEQVTSDSDKITLSRSSSVPTKEVENVSFKETESDKSSNLDMLKLNEKLDILLSKINFNENKDNKSNVSVDVLTSNDKLEIVEDFNSIILNEDSFYLDFTLYSKDTQVLANEIFKFYILKENTYVIPDVNFSHIKSPNNRLILQKLVENVPFKLEVWKEIYKLYFKSLFSLIFKLKPMSLKHIRALHNKMILADKESNSNKLYVTPAFNMTFNYDSVIGKIAYGYANGLFDMSVFLSSKFHKLDIDYSFNVENSTIHEITLVWFYLDNNGIERKISRSYQSKDLTYEMSIITDSWQFNDVNSLFYKNTYQNIFNNLLNVEKSEISFETLQMSSATRQIITSTQDQKSVWTDGFISRSIVNGPASFDTSNVYLLNSFISMLNIDNLNIDLDDSINDNFIKDFSIYLGGSIKYFITKNIKPDLLNLKFIKSSFSISKKSGFQSDSELHNTYKSLIRSGDIYPSTPVHFDFYFSKDTIKQFSEYIILSGLSNVSMNSSLKSLLPISDKSSKMNFSRYAKDRSLLSISTYITDVSFSFQKTDIFLSFDELLVEMYVKVMLLTKVPDYIPLITRGDWKGTDVASPKIICSYINNILTKYDLHEDEEFIKNIILKLICKFDKFTLSKVFKNKTRLVDICPDIFERFILDKDYTQNTLTNQYNNTDVDYLESNDLG